MGAEKLVSPTTVTQVQDIFKEASQEKTPLCVYRKVDSTAIKIDLSKLNNIIEIDSANLIATVEPGVTLGELNSALYAHRLRFIPAAMPFYRKKTIGEYYYEGCSHSASLKYGAAKHLIMGTEMVLPTGELLKTGGRTVKNVTGYDMTRFMNASFVNFGVTVKYLLKLAPLPEKKQTVALRFKTLEEVVNFVTALKRSKIVPAYLLWFDAKTQSLFSGEKWDTDLLVLELDGVAEEVAEQERAIQELLQHQQVITGEAEVLLQKLIGWEEIFTPSTGYVLDNELKFKYTEQLTFIQKIYALASQKNLDIGVFGQIAEGKINLYFADSLANVSDTVTEIIALAIQSKGYVAGNFGRSRGLGITGPLAQIEQQLKKTFDPADILKG